MEGFERYSERRSREALAAALPRFTTVSSAPDPDCLAIGSPWTEALFDGPFYLSPAADRSRPACNLVFVQSREGNTVASDPSSLGGGEADKHLIYEGLTRVAADGVLAGAGTIRGGSVVFSVWHPELVKLRESLGKPRHPVQIVATLQGLDFERMLILNVPDVPVVIITSPPAEALMRRAMAERPWIKTLVMEQPDRLPWALQQLRAMGIERVSAIGGRKLATQLIDGQLVDDSYMTTSPRSGGEPNTPLEGYSRGRLMVRKAGSGSEAGVVFEHFRLSSSSPA